MTRSGKSELQILEAIVRAKTVEEIKELATEIDNITKEDRAYYVVLGNLKKIQEKLLINYVGKLKPLWQAFFSITRSLELLVLFWDGIDNSVTDEIFYNQLKKFIPKIDNPSSLKNILDSINSESPPDIGNHVYRLIDRQEIKELIKKQTKKIIKKTDCHEILGNLCLENLVSKLCDTEITTLYFNKILEAELKKSST